MLSICVGATVAIGLGGVAGGTATAAPDAEACAIIDQTIQGQLAILGGMAVSNPANFARAAPGILASVQALRAACDEPPLPGLDQLFPQPPTTPSVPKPEPQPTPHQPGCPPPKRAALPPDLERGIPGLSDEIDLIKIMMKTDPAGAAAAIGKLGVKLLPYVGNILAVYEVINQTFIDVPNVC